MEEGDGGGQGVGDGGRQRWNTALEELDEHLGTIGPPRVRGGGEEGVMGGTLNVVSPSCSKR